MAPFIDENLKAAIRSFNERGQLGPDPLAARYAERRAGYSLFSRMLSDADIEALRSYLFCYSELPPRRKLTIRNFIGGEWRAPASGEHGAMTCPADKRVQLFDVPASGKQDVEAALASGDQVWRSLAWADEGLAYRKHVMQNVSRILAHYTEDFLHEIRQQIPKTRLEAEKDFFEAKRACDHLQGSYEAAIKGEIVPDMMAGQRFWRDAFMPAGLAAIITPMNFIWGIPMIHLAGAYLTGCPWIFKGHPFAGATNTSMVRCFLAAGADPRFIQKVEGFGKGIAPLATDHRVAVVAVAGSSDTARPISAGRGLARTRFEVGGCNWSWGDDGYYGSNAEAVKPALIDGVSAQPSLRHDWDGKGVREYKLATTELFMPILVAMPLPRFEDFVKFSLFDNPHDLATSIWTRDDRKLTRARRTLAGMLKENDGTDSALEWEEFGASTIGESGNMGVGEVQATISIYARRQKGRHFVF